MGTPNPFQLEEEEVEIIDSDSISVSTMDERYAILTDYLASGSSIQMLLCIRLLIRQDNVNLVNMGHLNLIIDLVTPDTKVGVS